MCSARSRRRIPTRRSALKPSRIGRDCCRSGRPLPGHRCRAAASGLGRTREIVLVARDSSSADVGRPSSICSRTRRRWRRSAGTPRNSSTRRRWRSRDLQRLRKCSTGAQGGTDRCGGGLRSEGITAMRRSRPSTVAAKGCRAAGTSEAAATEEVGTGALTNDSRMNVDDRRRALDLLHQVERTRRYGRPDRSGGRACCDTHGVGGTAGRRRDRR